MRRLRLTLRSCMAVIAGAAFAIGPFAASWRSVDRNSIRLEKGAEMFIVVLDSPDGRVPLNAAEGSRHLNGLSYEPLASGVRVKVVDDSHPRLPMSNPNGEGPRVVRDNREVDVAVISGPLSGTSGNVGRRFLRDAPWWARTQE